MGHSARVQLSTASSAPTSVPPCLFCYSYLESASSRRASSVCLCLILSSQAHSTGSGGHRTLIFSVLLWSQLPPLLSVQCLPHQCFRCLINFLVIWLKDRIFVFVISWLGTQARVFWKDAAEGGFSNSHKGKLQLNMGQASMLGLGLKDSGLFVYTIFSPSVPFFQWFIPYECSPSMMVLMKAQEMGLPLVTCRLFPWPF